MLMSWLACWLVGWWAVACECYSHAGNQMTEDNPDLDVLSVDDFMPVANQ